MPPPLPESARRHLDEAATLLAHGLTEDSWNVLENLDASVRGHAEVQKRRVAILKAMQPSRFLALRGAEEWLEEAVVEGIGEAQFLLALRHYLGDGVEQDFEAALCLFLEVVEPKNTMWPVSSTNLGTAQAIVGTAFSGADAVKWFRLAAERDDEFAQLKLGRLLRDGTGVEPDLVEALYWLTLAAAQTPPHPFIHKGDAERDRDVLRSRMSQEDVEKVNRRATDFIVARRVVAPRDG